jgi:hypothetical protein
MRRLVLTDARFTLIFSLAVGAGILSTSVGLGKGDPLPRTRIDQSRINVLIQIIQSDPDEAKRNAAVAELSRADPKLSTGAVQIVTDALLKDPSPKVRLAAVSVIGRYNAVFSLAGRALETATVSDASPEVRKAAKQALWEYHLLGYRSIRDFDEFTRQTPEPPIAKPAPLPIPVIAEPPVIPVAVKNQPPAVAQLPSVGLLPGPRVSPLPQQTGPITLLTAVPPHPNLTIEPPLAQSQIKTVTPPIVREPAILPHWPSPLSVGKPHPYAADLPPIVSPPDSIPGVTPPVATEPPLNKEIQK